MAGRLPVLTALARNLIGLGVTVAVFYFLTGSLVSNWGSLRDEALDINPALFILACLFLTADIIGRALIWRYLVEKVSGGRRLPAGLALKMFLYSWAGRYTPGKVGYLVGRFYLGRQAGLSTSALIGSMAYENVLLIVAGSTLAAATIFPTLAVQAESMLPYIGLPVLAAGGMAVLHPAVMRRGMRLGLRLLGREDWEGEWVLPLREQLKVVGFYTASFSLTGVGFYFMVLSLTTLSPGYLPLVAGAITLAGIAGMLSVVTPAGLGVREGVLAGILHITMSVELAALVALVARAWTTLVDIVVVAATLAYDYVSGDRLLIATIRGTRPDAEPAVDAT